MLSIRLASHLLTPHVYTQVSDVVRHYGCMQAQDIPQAMWVIWSRLIQTQDTDSDPDTNKHNNQSNQSHSMWVTVQDVKNACATWEIIRTRPMRGTLHYMAPENVHRMLDLCASKTLPGFAKRREFLGISDKHADRALEIMDSALRGGKSLTRSALGETLKAWGIPMQTQRVYHLACYAATCKLICFWPPTDKEETFVLLDERIKQPSQKLQNLTRDEQLAKLATMYIRSHGPVTVDDLARWTGLSKGDCKQAFALVAEQCETIEQDGKTYYYMHATHTTDTITTPASKTTRSPKIPTSSALRLLGGFDEYFIGYKDRSPVADTQHHGKLFTQNGIFFPLLLLDGTVVGTWKRTRIKTTKKNAVSIALQTLPWVTLPHDKIMQEAQKYAAFRGVEEAEIKQAM